MFPQLVFIKVCGFFMNLFAIINDFQRLFSGQKGIGFKSVFRVSDCPEVHSNGYHIRFDAKSGPIGYILPQWIEEGNVEEETCDDEFECFEASNNHEIQVDNGSEYER